jgi:hypothetical protein
MEAPIIRGERSGQVLFESSVDRLLICKNRRDTHSPERIMSTHTHTAGHEGRTIADGGDHASMVMPMSVVVFFGLTLLALSMVPGLRHTLTADNRGPIKGVDLIVHRPAEMCRYRGSVVGDECDLC